MDPRERWQALQRRLTAARAAVDAGDTAAALSEVTAALELDRDFLAAQALRDRILATIASANAPALSRRSPASRQPAPPPAVRPAPVTEQPVRPVAPVEIPVHSPLARTVRAEAASKPVADTPEMPAGYVKFEQPVKRRRVDQRIDAARAALDDRRIRAAASALDEALDLDLNSPELVELTARFDELRRTAVSKRRGPWVFAAFVFAIALFLPVSREVTTPPPTGSSGPQGASPVISSRRMASAAPLLSAFAPLVRIAERLAAGDTTAAPVRAEAPAPKEPRRQVLDPPPLAQAITAPATAPVIPPPVRVAAPVESPPRVPTADVARATPEPPPAAPLSPPAAAPAPSPVPAAAPTPPSVDAPDDSGLVRRVLQRYRTAYDGLDARSAQAVWPAVNQVALARAFDGLLSQSLTFEACDVKLRGEVATATCRGSARYVTKVGSRDPRVESRVWNFTLHKTGSDWQIDSARAER